MNWNPECNHILRPIKDKWPSAYPPGVDVRELLRHEAKGFNSRWGHVDFDKADPAIILRALEDYEEYNLMTDLSGNYVLMHGLAVRKEPDNSFSLKEQTRLNVEMVNRQKLVSFFRLSIGSLSKEQQKMLSNSPELQPYMRWLNATWEQHEHMLSEEIEQAMWSTYLSISALKEVFIKSLRNESFKIPDLRPVPYKLGELRLLLQNPDSKTRQLAREPYKSILERRSVEAKDWLNSILLLGKQQKHLRKWNRFDSSVMSQHEVNADDVDMLLHVTKANEDLSAKYYAHLAKILGVKKLKFHDTQINVGEVNKKIDLIDAYKLVLKVFNDIDPEYSILVEEWFKNGQIHLQSLTQKSSGGAIITRKFSPELVYVNFDGTIRSLIELTHELGHAIHFHLSKTQGVFDYTPSIMMAEFASKYFEQAMYRELLSPESDLLTPTEKMKLRIGALGKDIDSIFRQTSLYRFQLQLFNEYESKNNLTLIDVKNIFVNSMKDYVGNSLDLSDDIMPLDWIGWGHALQSFFYTYTYASGALSAKGVYRMGISKQVVRQVLSAGSSESPKELFARLGIDINSGAGWKAGIEELRKELDSLFTNRAEIC